MGLIRKTFAVGTVGLVRGNSKKQRVAKAQLQEIRKQTEIMRKATVVDSPTGSAGRRARGSDIEARGQAALARSRELQRIAKENSATEARVKPVRQLPSEGWYPDPDREHLLRWWDGQAWGDRTAPRV